MKTIRLALGLAPLALGYPTAHACTIFTLMDTNAVLFCNNEDWKESQIRIWFVPAGGGVFSTTRRYGCAYVGFGNMWPQGGLNTEGLAYDWVAGFKEKWEPDPTLKAIRGSSGQQMLESCATVQDAIVFFRTRFDYSFSYAKILVADGTGTSAIIGAKDGRLDVRIARESRGFGYSGEIVAQMLAAKPASNVSNAGRILDAARQQGQYATKYSNVFDLKSGDIFLFRFPEQPAAVKLSLADELKKGRHSYDIVELGRRLSVSH